MAAVTLTTMIKKKNLWNISSKFDHAELIGNHNFRIYEKKKRQRVSILCLLYIQFFSIVELPFKFPWFDNKRGNNIVTNCFRSIGL